MSTDFFKLIGLAFFIASCGGTRFNARTNVKQVCSLGDITIAEQDEQAMGGYPPDEGAQTFTVTTDLPECQWTIVSNDPWIVVNEESQDIQSGTQSIKITVLKNPSAKERQGGLTIGLNGPTTSNNGKVIPLVQVGQPCIISSLTPTGYAAPSAASSSSFAVEAVQDCAWTARAIEPWVHLSGNLASITGSAKGSVGFSLEASGYPPDRKGSIEIVPGGDNSKAVSFQIQQLAKTPPCAPQELTIEASDSLSDSAAREFTISSNREDCAWIATATESWIKIKDGPTSSQIAHSGPLDVTYQVDPSADTNNGTITIALAQPDLEGNTQVGTIPVKPIPFPRCNINDLTPNPKQAPVPIAMTGGSGQFVVKPATITPVACEWVVTAPDWIWLSTSEVPKSKTETTLNVSNEQTIFYTVEPNAEPLDVDRTGSIDLTLASAPSGAKKSYSIMQRGPIPPNCQDHGQITLSQSAPSPQVPSQGASNLKFGVNVPPLLNGTQCDWSASVLENDNVVQIASTNSSEVTYNAGRCQQTSGCTHTIRVTLNGTSKSRDFVIAQPAPPTCANNATITLSPTSINPGNAGGSNLSFTVSVPPLSDGTVCPWTANVVEQTQLVSLLNTTESPIRYNVGACSNSNGCSYRIRVTVNGTSKTRNFTITQPAPPTCAANGSITLSEQGKNIISAGAFDQTFTVTVPPLSNGVNCSWTASVLGGNAAINLANMDSSPVFYNIGACDSTAGCTNTIRVTLDGTSIFQDYVVTQPAPPNCATSGTLTLSETQKTVVGAGGSSNFSVTPSLVNGDPCRFTASVPAGSPITLNTSKSNPIQFSIGRCVLPDGCSSQIFVQLDDRPSTKQTYTVNQPTLCSTQNINFGEFLGSNVIIDNNALRQATTFTLETANPIGTAPTKAEGNCTSSLGYSMNPKRSSYAVFSYRFGDPNGDAFDGQKDIAQHPNQGDVFLGIGKTGQYTLQNCVFFALQGTGTKITKVAGEIYDIDKTEAWVIRAYDSNRTQVDIENGPKFDSGQDDLKPVVSWSLRSKKNNIDRIEFWGGRGKTPNGQQMSVAWGLGKLAITSCPEP